MPRVRGEGFVRGFDFLETSHVWIGFFEPCQNGIKARLDRIYIPGGDLHSLDRKAGAAAARGGCVRIVDLECGADHFVGEINFRASEKVQRHRVD